MGKLEAYGALLGEIKQRIQSAQYEALRAVNRELIALYWDIGHEKARELGSPVSLERGGKATRRI